jgi:hypothetical protein
MVGPKTKTTSHPFLLETAIIAQDKNSNLIDNMKKDNFGKTDQPTNQPASSPLKKL